MHLIVGNQITQTIIAELKAGVFRLAILAFLTGSLALRATPLASDTPIYEEPDTDSMIIGTVAAGTEPLPPFRGLYMIGVPGGWDVVGIDTSQDCWVRDNDLDKRLNVKLGTLLRAAPDADAAVIGKMEPGDLGEKCDTKGKWVQVRYSKRIKGYILKPITIDTPASGLTSTSTTSILVGAATVTCTATATAPAIVTATTLATAAEVLPKSRYLYVNRSKQYIGGTNPYFDNQAALMTEMQQLPAKIITGDTLPPMPRSFEGTFARTRGVFVALYQLNDSTGKHFAYLDLGDMSATQHPETFEGKTVIIYGTMLPMPNSKNVLIIKVETIQPK